MFKKKDIMGPEVFDTLVGVNTVFDGNIESDGTIRVDGKVNGDLRVKGDVYIGNNAEIKGNIFAKNVHLSGILEGNIYSEGLLKLSATGKLYGDIQIHSFVADEGGIFHGKCSMIDAPVPEPSVKKAVPPKNYNGRDYKKSSVLEQVDDEKEEASEA
ncbi:MAG: polymer-forming cytoskeletal protein [Clostridiales bacterium]|jgi:cytoskeletal protein CcmA (bactofilin family)|nr:polymer-forming cytoskeletal protein [Eubacteriales bacterium]MDH7566785.1 polymer-forming cytoskeletal protein [Clostridiales bacterium]